MEQNRTRSLNLSIVGYSENWTWQYRIIHDPIVKKIPFPCHLTPQSIQADFEAITNTLDTHAIKRWGLDTAKKIFPDELLHELMQIEESTILFEVPGEWADVPFELLYLHGHGYLGTLFLMGTVISVPNSGSIDPRKCHPSDLHTMLIIAPKLPVEPVGPKNEEFDTENAMNTSFQNFSKEIREVAKGKNWNVTSDFSGNKERIMQEAERASLVHFEVHSYRNAEGKNQGLEIGPDSVLNLKDIENIGSDTLTVPCVVFLNACSAGKAGLTNEFPDIAAPFLKAGVKSVIGPVKDPYAYSSREFVKCFYTNLVKGNSPAKALLDTKKYLIRKHPDRILPLFYRLFGDPRFKYPDKDKDDGPKPFWIQKPFVLSVFLICLSFLVYWFLLPPPPDTSQQQQIKMLLSVGANECDSLRKIIKPFCKENNVTILLENISFSETITKIERGDTFDILIIDINKIHMVDFENFLEDVDHGKQIVPPNARWIISKLEAQSNPCYIPFRLNVKLLFLNKLSLQATCEGMVPFPDTITYQDFLNFAKQYKHEQSDPVVFLHGKGSDTPLLLLEFIRAAGGDPRNFLDGKSIEAMNFLQSLLPYAALVDWATAASFLLQNKVCLGQSWPYIFIEIEKLGKNDNFDIAPTLRWSKNSPPYTLLGGDYIALNKHSQYSKVSKKLIQFFVSPKVQNSLAKMLGSLTIFPIKKNNNSRNRTNQIISETLDYAEPVPPFWNQAIITLYKKMYLNSISKQQIKIDSISLIKYQNELDSLISIANSTEK